MKTNRIIKCFMESNIIVAGVYEVVIARGQYIEGASTSDDFCGLVIPISGQATYEVNRESYELKEGCVLHAGSSMSLNKYVDCREKWHYILIHYDVLESLEAKVFLENINFEFDLEKHSYDKIKKIGFELVQLYKNTNSISKYGLKVKLHELIFTMLESKKGDLEASDKEKIESIKEYIEDNIDKVLGIQELANTLNMEISKFTYLFTKMNSMSPKKYINQIKIKKAELLLINSEYHLTEIASLIGYDDPFYFSRFFKKHTGYAPSDFRKLLGKSPS